MYLVESSYSGQVAALGDSRQLRPLTLAEVLGTLKFKNAIKKLQCCGSGPF